MLNYLQLHPIQIPDLVILNAEIIKRLALAGMPKGNHEQGNGLLVSNPLVIPPCLAHGVRAVIALKTNAPAPPLDHIIDRGDA